jgi:hypothetical protein
MRDLDADVPACSACDTPKRAHRDAHGCVFGYVHECECEREEDDGYGYGYGRDPDRERFCAD